jgi:hypothetical protein
MAIGGGAVTHKPPCRLRDARIPGGDEEQKKGGASAAFFRPCPA